MSLSRLLVFSSLLAGYAIPVLATGTDPVPQASVLLDTQKTTIPVLPRLTAQVPGLKTPSTVCFSLREYKFTRVPETNAFKATGDSTCEDAAQFQLKDAIQELGRHQ